MKDLRAFAAALLLWVPATAMAAGDIVVHRDPGCGCCSKWAAQLRQQIGRPVTMVDDHKRRDFQKRAGVPGALSSCHTAVIDGLAFEGHVPFQDIQRLLKERPKGVAGLAVAGMPLGSPGMEVAGVKSQPFQVIAFGAAGQKVYSRH